ncbi:MAG TPA: sugar phosphate nucleotidyltransferase [Phnomibacter sp.]|nr:sugar phosphate nucleotidyltransferase [Phnomibacter sp.]
MQYEPEPVADNVYPVRTFTEKPNLELAKTFIASGDFLWNAGIFVWKTADILAEFEQHLPEMHEAFIAEKEHFDTPAENEALQRIYPQCGNLSIDYGIMEHAENVYIIPSAIGWSDLGTWNSAYDSMDKDYFGNAIHGKNYLMIDANRNLVHVPNHKMVVLQGLDDCVVVDTQDVLLICRKDREQEIKDYMAEVKKQKGDRYL